MVICLQIKVYKSLYHLHSFYNMKVFEIGVVQGSFQYICQYFWVISIVPVILGFFYAIFKIIFKEKKVCFFTWTLAYWTHWIDVKNSPLCLVNVKDSISLWSHVELHINKMLIYERVCQKPASWRWFAKLRSPQPIIHYVNLSFLSDPLRAMIA